MGKHLCGKQVNGTMYRDSLMHEMDGATFHALTDGHSLPEGYSIYHYSSDLQWERVLQLPVYDDFDTSIRMEIEILLSPFGACRRCRIVPADGLWQGRFPIIHEMTGSLIRTSPYKGYICEQCADNLEWETHVRGTWIK